MKFVSACVDMSTLKVESIYVHNIEIFLEHIQQVLFTLTL